MFTQRIVKNGVYYFTNGRKDYVTTWFNNSKFAFPLCIILMYVVGLMVEGLI